ncbi:Six-hairpin glycosidase-like protein [Chaetomium strumarium]|uniref:Six-hairpin glycosidase-like protein n=1 Tax=Chaetomium strumarium TaxID=1170767 RepID=A0AAJ0M3I5_9PEZI|nr:Six-hairpin glycosidase-like protein [Chaetomium strumarium]
MAAEQFDDTWIWHPSFTEERADTAGLLVHFRRDLVLDGEPPESVKLHLTADTRYKLFVNSRLVTFGPVKGDLSRWFYDEVDIGPFLVPGTNRIRVLVLRFFNSTYYAATFPRGPVGGLRIVAADKQNEDTSGSSLAHELRGGSAWETAIDPFTILPINEPEDDFLHTYERVTRPAGQELEWVAARSHRFQKSTGVVPPWHLSPRLIPRMALKTAHFTSLHNVQSRLPLADWEAVLVHGGGGAEDRSETSPRGGLVLPAGSSHRIDIEAPHHMTAFLRFRFGRSSTAGSKLSVRYAESYEDTPVLVPYLRRKGHRCDYSKSLFGPVDQYELQGAAPPEQLLGHYADEENREVFAPFHFRSFRFLQLTIDVGPSDLVFEGVDVQEANYPLDVVASAQAAGPDAAGMDKLWSTSVRTLVNCMHDTYEDCPFYEQLQYAMDTRSTILFTYYVSGDDRLARQAMLQLRDSFQPGLGLTSSRAPAHKPQVIPHFSLFWVAMLADHWAFFGDAAFLAPFGPVVDAVLGYFDARVDRAATGLVVSDNRDGVWNFVDWTEQWRPYGIPPAAVRTSVCTYTNHLYAYALKRAAELARVAGRPHLAEEYVERAAGVVRGLRAHCFDRTFFTDSLAAGADAAGDYSVHNQVWAVLSGAAAPGPAARDMLRHCLSGETNGRFVQASVSMAFYTLRALSAVGGGLYDELFHGFWAPWRAQLDNGVTTWEEDAVSQRSDCHAWGSAPLYELTAEVAGVRPAGPGWAAVCVEPRLALFPEFKAAVPMKAVDGSPTGMVHVSWRGVSPGVQSVALRVELADPAVTVPVHVKLPGQPVHVLDSSSPMDFVVRRSTQKAVVEQN